MKVCSSWPAAERGGPVGRAGWHVPAECFLAELQRRFRDHFYLEIMRTQRAGEDAFNAFALHAAAANGFPVIASNDVRFLDATASTRTKRASAFPPVECLRMRTSAVILGRAIFEIPGRNGRAVRRPARGDREYLGAGQRCNLEMRFGTYFLPEFPIPAGHTLDSWIRSQSRAGLTGRLEKNRRRPATPQLSSAAGVRSRRDRQDGFAGFS